jgi:hypothetical protein
VSDDRPVIGWCRTDKVGPCVDPFDKGAHMAEGGVTNVKRADEDDPPIMCRDCFDELRSGAHDPAPT